MNGKINVSYNCVDRHAAKNPDRVAIIYEGDEPTDIVKITFGELLERVRHLIIQELIDYAILNEVLSFFRFVNLPIC